MQTNNKLREVLVEIIDYLEPIRKWTMPSKENHTRLTALFAAVDTVYTKANAALEAPARNCDVGTAEEQEDRFRRYCNSRGTFCGDCPLYNNRRGECRFAWAQMPYEEGGAK